MSDNKFVKRKDKHVFDLCIDGKNNTLASIANSLFFKS